ncbi:MAG: ribokinase [Planctomycetes bacterium]|nr:ribokinase [Planctomycetota bacterium]
MTGKSPKIVVVGGCYIDMAIKCDRVPLPGESLVGSALSYSISGPGPAQAIQAALCGCEVYLIGKVGNGSAAEMLKKNLEEYGINIGYLNTVSAKNTGCIVTIVNAAGDNTALTYFGANSSLLASDIKQADAVISEADICLIHGQLPDEAVREALLCASAHGTKVILDPAHPLGQVGKESQQLPAEYFSADIVIPNLYEAADITESVDANMRVAKLIGSDLIARGVNTAIITMGRRGCMIVDRNDSSHVKAFDVDLVDQSGAGDAFAGALAAFCAVGGDIVSGVKFASAAGALACTKFGSVEALPSKTEIIELLQRQDFGSVQ